MKVFAFVAASFSAFSWPLAVAGRQQDSASLSAPALEALGRGTLANALSDAKSGGTTAVLGYSRGLRQLEFTEACNNTYNELWSDADLNDAYMFYSTNLDAAIEAATSPDTDACVTEGNDVKCVVSSGVEGEDEFISTCDNAGGAVDSVPMEITCALTLDGEIGSIYLDLPDALDCYPTDSEFQDCKDALIDTYYDVLQFMEEILEGAYLDAGYTNVNCDVGAPVDQDTDQAKNSGAAAPQILWTTTCVASVAISIGALLLA